jgi:lipoprotein-anchoring transpeptidase ErfK/SrfK
VKRPGLVLLLTGVVAHGLLAGGALAETAPTIPASVTIGGLPVGGLTAAEAEQAVRAYFARPLVLLLADRRVEAEPGALGAAASVQAAIAAALAAAPATAVPLQVTVSADRVARYVDSLAAGFDQAAVNSTLSLRKLKPYLSPSAPGRRLDRPRAADLIVSALQANRRAAVRLRVVPVAPSLTPKTFGPVLVVRRTSQQLALYDGMRLERKLRVLTESDRYPTPLGRFTVTLKSLRPWFYPSEAARAAGATPIPPGPGNPLGTDWLGLSAPGVGIHYAPDAASLGYSITHGCVRLSRAQADWLFSRVDVGTPVFIVAA